MSSPPCSPTPACLPNPSNPPQSSIMPRGRSAGRDVHIYDDRDHETELGGLILTNGVTNANFHQMLGILFPSEGSMDVRHNDDTYIGSDESPLRPGNYYLGFQVSSEITNDEPITRMLSAQTGARVHAFRKAVRSRDRRCIISKQRAVRAHLDHWEGFQAAHIFPLAKEEIWEEKGYSSWIKILPEDSDTGTINSVQNGLLLRSDIHQDFDCFLVSINPEDNYKITYFDLAGHDLAGTYLDQEFLDDPQRPSDDLLRWHFKQAVLANMKGVGEPHFEHDFPPGSDIVNEILCGPKAAERMEFELFSRLAAQVKLET